MVKMTLSYCKMNIILFGLICVVFGATVSTAKDVRGQLTVKGVTCKYFEKKPNNDRGGGPRGIRICSCKNDKGVIKKDCTYYPNNPHDCGNKYNKNQEAYYKALAESAMENGAPCAKSSISETICGLKYPCEMGDCPSGRRRRDVDSGTCPAFTDDEGSLTSSDTRSSTTKESAGLMSIYVCVLATFMIKSFK